MGDVCRVKGCYSFGRYCRIPGHMKAEAKEKESVTIVTGKPVKRPPSVTGKKKVKIACFSKKRAKLQREYRKVVKEIIDTEGDQCEVKSPVCVGRISGLNHKQKRSAKNMKLKKNLQRCCTPCNQFIEENPEWAKKNGHQVSRFVKL